LFWEDAMSIEETKDLRLEWNGDRLIPAIIQDAADGAVLMMAWMNAEALAKTRETGLIHFYSRSRGQLWMKGETSGETFRVRTIRVDCDQDCLLVGVTPEKTGAACHTGRRSCFYREVEGDGLVPVT
jgi:phosphoribosyl-AMP cyclohydrolase